jgi:hypothetical protein
MAEGLRAPNSNSVVSDQQSVGSSPCRNTSVLKQVIKPLLRPSDGRSCHWFSVLFNIT